MKELISENKKILDMTSNINLKSLECYKIDQILYSPLYLYKKNYYENEKSINKYLKVLKSMFTIGIEFKKKGSGAIALVFSNSYRKRKDHLSRFELVESVLDNEVIIKPGREKFCFNGFALVHLIYHWNRELNRVGVKNKSLRFYLIRYLCDAYQNASYIYKHINTGEVKHLSVFSDAHPIDNLLVQMCKRHNISTSTMQHGIYYEEGYNNSNSDYFLAWGEQSKKRANIMGIDPKHIKVVGFPKLIHYNISNKIVHNNTHKLVFICSELKEDITVLECLRIFAKNNNYKIWIKVRPDEKFSNYENDDVIEKIVTNQMTIDEITNYVDFAVTTKSTVFVEYLIKMFPTFLYKSDYPVYDEITWCKFEGYDQLNELYEMYYKNSELLEKKVMETREYFTVTSCIDENYSNFYKMFIS